VSGPTRRLFIGLLPADEVRGAIADHQRHWYWSGGSLPTRPERLHLTLHFLGEINATREHALRSALAGEDVAPFELLLQTPECWAGGIAVLRPDENTALDDLHARLTARLSHIGIAPMRGGFAPHVTLARGAVNAAPPEAMRPLIWTVTDFALVWSRPGPPARYEVLDRYGAT
jgi:RNA 2',3'-cyclic 3'-phosphodiesterase